MNTQIFGTYSDFLQREDKSLNGVNQDFANDNPDYEKQNKKNEGCWSCIGCSGCSDCIDCIGCSGCSDCIGCSGCSGCIDCIDCIDCSDCSGLQRQLNIKNEETKTTTNPISGFPNVPVIEAIHQKLYNTIKPNGHSNKLQMDAWHTCETTHCRAGWIVHLAGQPGYDLESETSTQFAAMQIYKASSPIRVSPVRFFESNKVAMADVKRCAEEEKKLLPTIK